MALLDGRAQRKTVCSSRMCTLHRLEFQEMAARSALLWMVPQSCPVPAAGVSSRAAFGSPGCAGLPAGSGE